MRRFTLVILLIMSIILVNNIDAQSKPILVISSTVFNFGDNGIIYPEIAVNGDGTWREAAINDLWVGQEFKVFIEKDYQLQEEPSKIVLKVNSIDNENGYFDNKTNGLEGNDSAYGLYSITKPFINKGIGLLIKPKTINYLAQKEFTKNQANISRMLENVVKYDETNIKKDFQVIFPTTIKKFMIGDINGDQKNDYVLVLGGDFGGSEDNVLGAVVIAYISDHNQYERLPIMSWKKASDYYGWPGLLLMKDFNGDNAEEVFIADCDSDTSIPIVYSWFKDKNGLMKLLQGERALSSL